MKLAVKNKRKAGLNLTPLIDVLFILIIFFAVSSTFLEQPGIELKLPEAESGVDLPMEKIVIHIDKTEKLYINDKAVSREELADQVLELIGDEGEKSVTLNADTEVHHGAVISLMDDLRKKGIYKITVSTVKPSL